ncbi:MATE family Na+-driven efflux transporter [Endozoicomonas ascidiicola]|uniref:MATE family Na+-driven efflux transporter n=1 Tax=Endozoicomonas ascidiicola TaxID=1698521 RepID=UPI0034549345
MYSTARVYFLGDIPDTWGYSIAAQAAWLNLFYEVISEGLLLPLYFILGQVISSPKLFSERINVALQLVVGVYVLLSGAVLFFAEPLVQAMGQAESRLVATVSYIRLESIALLLSSVYAVVMVVLVLQNRERLMYQLLVLKTVTIIALDTILVSQLPISFQLGVNGVAWSNIIVNAVLTLISLRWLFHSGITLTADRQWLQRRWIKAWIRISVKSGLESLIRNLAFMLMILKMVNEVEQAGVYWVTNQFIWGWLLLPVITLGNLIKQDSAKNGGELGARFKGYFQVTLFISTIWLLTLPGWEWFVHRIMGAPQASEIAYLAGLMLAFYIVFAFNNILDSYFYGIGRTDMLLYQSLIVSCFYYGSAYLLYLQGKFVPTLDSIAILFGIGITLDALVTAVLFYIVVEKQRLWQLSHSV